MFAAVCVLAHAHNQIENEMAEGFLDFEDTDVTREPSCSDLRAERALLRTQVSRR